MNTRPRIGCCLLLLGCVVSGWGQTNPSAISDAAIREVLVRVADRQLRISANGSTPRLLADGDYPIATSLTTATDAAQPQGIEWNYPWGVNLYGLLQAYRATGNTDYRDFVLGHNLIVARYYAWLRSLHNSLTNTSGLASFQQSTALRETFLNDTSAGKLDYCGAATAQFMEGILQYAATITSEQVQMALNTARYISSRQARLPDGTLYRPERNNTIWADDLYMSCPFLIRWYLYTGDSAFLDDAARQIMNMAGYLQDTDGLWFHGYFYSTSSTSGYKWSRANGWAMVATVEVLSVMPTNHPARSNLLEVLRKHIEGVKAVQADSGRWHQVLDHPELWEETSSSAMFTYSIARAVNRGWIDRTNMGVARKGFAGISEKVDPYGAVLDVCQGTGIGTTLSFYANRSRPYDDMHGRGALMLAGAEILLRPELRMMADATTVSVSWPAGVRDDSLQTSTNLAQWQDTTTAPTLTTNWESRVTETADERGFYRLRMEEPSYPATPLVFEAESLDWVAGGATGEISTYDSNASAGYFVTLFGDSEGDYYEFTLPNIPSGTYRLQLSFKTNVHRARVAVMVDGNPLDATLDEYWYETVYPLMDFGPVTFAGNGGHTIRLTVIGHHGASTGYTITADRFILAPE